MPEPRDTPGRWYPANNGSGSRTWFLLRDVHKLFDDVWVTDYRENAWGYLIRYASYETAQRAADKLNATEVTS